MRLPLTRLGGNLYYRNGNNGTSLVRISNLTATPSVTTFSIGSTSLAFGDIAIDANGKLYGHTSNSRFFSADIQHLATASSGTAINFSVDIATNTTSLQIAFSTNTSDPILYAHNFAGANANNRWFTVNHTGNATSNSNFGDATAITGWNNRDPLFRDIAEANFQPVPAPPAVVALGIGCCIGLVGVTGRKRRVKPRLRSCVQNKTEA